MHMKSTDEKGIHGVMPCVSGKGSVEPLGQIVCGPVSVHQGYASLAVLLGALTYQQTPVKKTCKKDRKFCLGGETVFLELNLKA